MKLFTTQLRLTVAYQHYLHAQVIGQIDPHTLKEQQTQQHYHSHC